jgi:hypothetical protein
MWKAVVVVVMPIRASRRVLLVCIINRLDTMAGLSAITIYFLRFQHQIPASVRVCMHAEEVRAKSCMSNRSLQKVMK